jgi:hypothetical protein
MVFLDSPVLSEAPSGATAAGPAIELVWVAADPDRAFVTLHRGARWRLRAVLFVSPALRRSLLACGVACSPSSVSSGIRIALHDACTTTRPAVGARAGVDPGGAVDMASNARRAGNSSESVAGQRFSAARQSFSKRRRSLSASPPRQSSETRSAVPPWRSWHWSNWAPK